MSEQTSTVDNGVNVGALLEAREALAEAPEAAQFKWRATCNWVGGTCSKSSVEGFFGLGEEQMHKSTFSFDADHPEVCVANSYSGSDGQLVHASTVRTPAVII